MDTKEINEDLLCIECFCQPVVKGKQRCSFCLEKAKRRYLNKKQNLGVCVHCSKNKAKDGLNICQGCSERKSKYYQTIKDQLKEKRKRAISEGLCFKCFSVKARHGLRTCESCSNKERKRQKQKHNEIKKEAFKIYGDGRCACCGESEISFLSLDHKYNDGNKLRKTIKNYRNKFYEYLKSHDFPDRDRIQVLCFNCNLGREKTEDKVCPHKKSQLVFEDGAGI